MFLSVIIPTCNRNDLLRKCLVCLSPENQTINSSKYEIIVTDDSKSNNELEILKEQYKFVRFVTGPQKGPAANRNYGAKFAKGDWLIFIDDDCLPDINILNEYYNEIIKEQFGAFEGYIDADRPKERYDEVSPINLKGGCFWSCNIAVNKEIYISIGGFDEGFPFPALEDTDIYNRLKSVTKINFLENAKVIHPWRRPIIWDNYKKWIKCHEYSNKKSNTIKNFNYRIGCMKLFLGVINFETLKLVKFKFLGFQFYIEVLTTKFVMIFI